MLWVLCTVLYGEGLMVDGLLWAVVVYVGTEVGNGGVRKEVVLCYVGKACGIVSSCAVYGSRLTSCL